MLNGTIDDIAEDLGMSTMQLLSRRVDRKNLAPSIKRMDRHLGRLDAEGRFDHLRDVGGNAMRLDSNGRRDNATAFLSSALEETLSTITIVENTNYLFVPGRTREGRGPLVPVQQKVPWGKLFGSWGVLGFTGEARNVGAGGTKSLIRVGRVRDKKQFPVSMYGVRIGWSDFELMQAAHLPEVDVQGENREAGLTAMADKMERNGSFGDPEREKPGFFNGGVANTISLAKSFGDPTLTFDEAMVQLSIIHLMWNRANPDMMIDSVAMPETHRLRLIRLFRGTDGDTSLWKWALEMFPWLANIVTDDRLLTASSDGGPIWQLWSNNPNELWFESTPAPALFGPFEFEMQTDFIMLAQDGGVINRRSRRVHRFEMPAVS